MITSGSRERRLCSKSDPPDGGAMRGSVVDFPQRKQMSALSAISVWQYLHFMSALGSRPSTLGLGSMFVVRSQLVMYPQAEVEA